MTNADMPVYPIIKANDLGENLVLADGITKREYFASQAMQGILSGQAYLGIRLGDGKKVVSTITTLAVTFGDALLAELERRKNTLEDPK